MNELLSLGAEAVSMFCRLNINSKKDLPIRSSEMGLLILIVKSEKPITPLCAAEFFNVSKPMIANLVNQLMKKGYVEKKPSSEDKRSYCIVPTDSALTLVESTYHEYSKVMQLLLDGMGEERFKELIRLLQQANTIISDKGNHRKMTTTHENIESLDSQEV